VRFFVTGGAGFIGSALVRELLSGRHDVVVYDSLERGRRSFLPSGVGIVEGDVRDRERVGRAMVDARPDWVVHLAALHFIPDCVARPEETRSINVGGTASVIDAVKTAGVGGVLFASSAAVYAPSAAACKEAASGVEPCDVYGESKLRGEELLRELHAQTAATALCLRIFNAAGARETNPHVLPHVLTTLKTSDRVPLGNTKARRDYIDTRDIARAILALAERARGYEAFNVGSGKAFSVAEILELLREKLGRPITAEVDASRLRPVDRELLVADISKIQSAVGWAPRFGLSEALDEMLAYYDVRRGA